MKIQEQKDWDWLCLAPDDAVRRYLYAMIETMIVYREEDGSRKLIQSYKALSAIFNEEKET